MKKGEIDNDGQFHFLTQCFQLFFNNNFFILEIINIIAEMFPKWTTVDVDYMTV